MPGLVPRAAMRHTDSPRLDAMTLWKFIFRVADDVHTRTITILLIRVSFNMAFYVQICFNETIDEGFAAKVGALNAFCGREGHTHRQRQPIWDEYLPGVHPRVYLL